MGQERKERQPSEGGRQETLERQWVEARQQRTESEKHCLPVRCEEHKGNTKPKEMLDQGHGDAEEEATV